MTPSRSGLALVSVLLLAACAGQALPGEAQSDELHYPDGSQKWVPVPVTPAAPEDDGFQPVSIKVPPRRDAGTSGRSGSSSSSGWSSSSSSSGGPTDFPDGYWGPPMANDLYDPSLAAVCADRAAAKGSYAIMPADARVPMGHRVSVTRDLTEHRYGDGVYRTMFTIFFRSEPDRIADEHGLTRIESLAWINVHLDAIVSQPNAFRVGEPQEVAIGWGAGDDLYACSEDGLGTDWENGEELPYDKGVVTLTRRDATGLAGTIEIGGGATKLTFDAPFGETRPGEDAICCLK